MTEVEQLKKSLLETRREYARVMFELADLQLKVLERETKAAEGSNGERQAPVKPGRQPASEPGRGTAAANDK